MAGVWRAAADIVIEPDVAGFAYDDFKRADDLIHAGEVAMRKALPSARKWLESPGGGDLPGHGLPGHRTPRRATSGPHASGYPAS